jgi:hypothetical protein
LARRGKEINNEWIREIYRPRNPLLISQGPQATNNIEKARENGINCISLAHLVIESLFEFKLPKELHCYELFNDMIHFDEVTISDMKIGDLIWFGIDNPNIDLEEFTPIYQDNRLVNYKDFPVKHVGIFDHFDSDGIPQILHSTMIDEANTVWAIDRFSQYKRYQKIYGVRRLRDDYKKKSLKSCN